MHHRRTSETRAIVLECTTPMLIDVVVELSQHYGWNPVYITSNYTQDLVKRHLPSAVYQETVDARYGRPVPELADITSAGIIDQPTSEALGYAEVMALKQMDRMELLGGFSLRERFLHFHRLVNYWSAVFDRLRPDVLLLIDSPHVVYDYVAYMLARRRGIRTVLFEYVTTEGLLMAIDRFEDGLPPLMAEYRRLRASPPPEPVVLSDRMESYWRRLKGSHDQAMPLWTRNFLADAEKRRLAALEAEKLAEAKAAEQPVARAMRPILFFSHLRAALAPLRSSRRRMLRAMPSLVLHAIRKTLWPPTPAGVPAPRPAPPPVDGHYKGRFYDYAPEDLARASADFRRNHGEAMRRRYNELAVEPDFTRPYVYVALSMQPERSTNPNGGVFDDQDVMVGMIAAALPAGWHIYVKEHPSQFVDGVRVERGRWENFYDAVVAHPNVSVVPLQTPSFDLIDHARAVASVTGTSSWEAIVRGIPALLFGEAWYKGCDGAHTIRTVEDCRQALALIAAGKRPDPEAVRLFLHAVDQTAFVGYLGPDEKQLAQVEEAANVTRIARAIAECYETATIAVKPLTLTSA
jgi:Capsule polysaccharide biosynthesis protein